MKIALIGMLSLTLLNACGGKNGNGANENQEEGSISSEKRVLNQFCNNQIDQILAKRSKDKKDFSDFVNKYKEKCLDALKNCSDAEINSLKIVGQASSDKCMIGAETNKIDTLLADMELIAPKR